MSLFENSDGINMKLLEIKAEIFKALSHPSRIIMLEALSKNQLCVCELQKLVGADMSTVSKHLTVSKDAGVVFCEKRGSNIYYTLKADCVIGFLTCIEDFIRKEAADRLDLVSSSKKKA